MRVHDWFEPKEGTRDAPVLIQLQVVQMAGFASVLIISLVMIKAYESQEERKFNFDFPGDWYNNCVDVVGISPPPGTLIDHDSFNFTVQFSVHTDFEDSEDPRAFLTTSYIDYTPRVIPESVLYTDASQELVTFVFNVSSERRQLMKSVNCIAPDV